MSKEIYTEEIYTGTLRILERKYSIMQGIDSRRKRIPTTKVSIIEDGSENIVEIFGQYLPLSFNNKRAVLTESQKNTKRTKIIKNKLSIEGRVLPINSKVRFRAIV